MSVNTSGVNLDALPPKYKTAAVSITPLKLKSFVDEANASKKTAIIRKIRLGYYKETLANKKFVFEFTFIPKMDRFSFVAKWFSLVCFQLMYVFRLLSRFQLNTCDCCRPEILLGYYLRPMLVFKFKSCQ